MKKKQVKALAELSKALPKSMELQKFSFAIQGSDIPIDIRTEQNLEEQTWYKKKDYRLVEVNHLNRLKNAFARDKEQGLVDYIEWVGVNNRKLNKLFADLNLKDLDDNLKNVVLRGASNFWQNIINFLYAFYQSFVKTKKESILAD